MTWRVRTASFLVLMGMSVWPGCKRHTPCGRLYERYKKCDKTFKMQKKNFLEICRTERKEHPEAMQPRLECAKKGSCEAFRKCLDETRRKQIAQDVSKALDEAVQKETWGQAMARCAANERDLTPALKKRCRQIAQKAFESLQAKIRELRDKGVQATDATAASLCSQLQMAAERLGKAGPAKVLCTVELPFARRVKQLVTKAPDLIKADPAKAALACLSVVHALAKSPQQTEWTKKARQDVTTKCVVPAAKAVVAKVVASKPKTCPPEIIALRKTAHAAKVTSADFEAALAPISKLCPEETDASGKAARGPGRPARGGK